MHGYYSIGPAIVDLQHNTNAIDAVMLFHPLIFVFILFIDLSHPYFFTIL